MAPSDDDRDDPPTIEVDGARARAIVTWPPGVPVFMPWMETMESLLAHPQFRPEFAVISDWRRASGAPDQAFVDAFLVFCQSIRRARRLTGRWAIVVAHDLESGLGVGRSAELQAANGSSEARVFRSLDDAIAWTTSSAAP